MPKVKLSTSAEDMNSWTVEELQVRILELEQHQERGEADAARAAEIIEELDESRRQAELSLKQAEEYQETIKEMALYDPLTGLANRNRFHERLDEALRLSKRDGSPIGLLLLDLDKFKTINDSFGHPVGDELLKYVAEKLLEVTRETDTVARLGGDEFAVILTLLNQEERAATVAERIVECLSETVTMSGCLIKSGTSIGISLSPHDSTDAEELIRISDKALYVAKDRGRGNYQFFDDKMDQESKAAHVLESDLRMAIVRKEFELHYQPQMTANGEALKGFEALVRWQHPTKGLVMPMEFIAVAEANGLLVNIGKSVLVEACRQRKEWDDMGLGEFRVAVNISPTQFQKADFVDSVADALEKSNLNPSLLELEVTEAIMIDDMDRVSDTMQQLRNIGIDVAIDDFGTGYSSLAYLKRLNIEKLKIDKTFVDNLVHSADDRAITEAIINMAHTLGLGVVAEGVEDEGQAAILCDQGCDDIQGYLYSKPMAQDTCTAWVTDFYQINDQEVTVN